jgi:hypothetical protein
MTSVVELMSNAIGHAEAQLLGQEALKALSGLYDQLDGRGAPATPASASAPSPVPAPAKAGLAGGVCRVSFALSLLHCCGLRML